jgi:hypothetical protein
MAPVWQSFDLYLLLTEIATPNGYDVLLKFEGQILPRTPLPLYLQI